MTYITTSSNSALSDMDDLNLALAGTTLKAISTWDDVVQNTYGVYFIPDPVPLKSPNNAPPYFSDWDFCYDVSADEFAPYFTFDNRIINFGKNRGTTIMVDPRPNGGALEVQIRAYFRIESYVNSGVFYKTPYVYGMFVSDLVG